MIPWPRRLPSSRRRTPPYPVCSTRPRPNYLASIDDNAEQIQQVYQQTLNGGFRGMAIFVAIVALIGLLVLVPYKDNRPGQKNEVIEV